MRIYLAARFGRRVEMRAIALRLLELGHDITSRWVWSDNKHVDDGVNVPEPLLARGFADDDLEDLSNAQLVISFMEPPGVASRGGRHTEFGYALAKGKQLWIVGQPEHIFHTLLRVQIFPCVDQVIQRLSMFDCTPPQERVEGEHV